MKKKIISNTYLRNVDKYQIRIFLDEDEYYISVKKIIHTNEKFIIKDNLCVIDDNYYVFEVVPKNDNYAMRIFLDDKKNPLEYYFDICKNNGLYENTNIPCYDDLYLDITYLCTTGEINILDEDDLIEAYKIGDISKEDLDLVYHMKDRLLDEIKKKKNKAMNIKVKKYLKGF